MPCDAPGEDANVGDEDPGLGAGDGSPRRSCPQIDFTYLKIIGWGWMYLFTGRYIIAWKLYSTIRAEDVTDTWKRDRAGCRPNWSNAH